MRLLRTVLACGVAAFPMMALAQERLAERVEVHGKMPAVQVLPDRMVYAIDQDLQSSTGSAIDVLRNLPSVEIDVQGAVSLRGDSNVTILIDGKPSALLAGTDALEQLPADQIDRIEVITNPSAQFKAEGSGGIINIIMKRDAGGADSLSVRANAGNNGRVNASVSGSTKVSRVKLSGGLSFRRDARERTGENERTRADGLDRQTTSNKSHREVMLARAHAEAPLDENNEVALGIRALNMIGWSMNSEHNVSPDGLTETVSDRFGPARRKRSITEFSFEYTHAFARKGEELKVELERGTDWGDERSDYTIATPGQADSFERWQSRETENELSFKADYVLPFEGGAKLKAGYDYEMGRNSYDNLGEHRDAPDVDWVIFPDFTNVFVVNQTVHSGYATFEDKFGALGALAGLRLERTGVTADQRTMGSRVRNSYLGLYPSLHLTYDVSDGHQLRASYSRRINRPRDHDLNPSLEYRDAFNVSSGNPYLKPETTDSIELGYKFTTHKYDTLLTAYYRRTRDGFTDVSRYISDSVLLTTKDNLARSLRTGLEFTANGDILTSLSFQLNANGYYDEIDPGPASLGVFRSGLAWGGKLSFDYKPTADDQFQLSSNYTARRLQAQGYRLPGFYADLGYRHKFSESLSGVATVSNLFDSLKDKTILTAGVHEVSLHRHVGRTIFVGFVYSIGNARQNDEGPQDTNGD